MSIYYKFKSELTSPEIFNIKIDGDFIAVEDLKKRIFQQRGIIAQYADFDLRFENAHTKEVYGADKPIIWKNTSVIVDRVSKKKSGFGTYLKNPLASQKCRTQPGVVLNYNGNGTQNVATNSMGQSGSRSNSIPLDATRSRVPDFSFKIAILGNVGTGKSSVLQRFADEAFDPNCPATTGCDLRLKTIVIANKCIQLKLWDTAGQERYRNSIVGSYLRNCHGLILCYDVSDLDTLASIHEWNDFALKFAPERVMKIMVGNKMDLWNSNQRQVEPEYIANVANNLCIPNLNCSAKDADNVEAVFRTLATQILEYQLESETSEANQTVILQSLMAPKRKVICCNI